jgi:hypothetical protein
MIPGVRTWVATASLLVTCGCANLHVKKVPLTDRATGQDDQRGFRYYLSRPYIAVNKKVLVCERRSLVMVDKAAKNVCFLDGPRANQVVPLSDLKATDVTSGVVRPVTEAELQQMRRVVERVAGGRPSPQTGGGVVPVSAAQGPAVPPGPIGPFAEVTPDTSPLNVPATQSTTVAGPPALAGAIQVHYLPDFDEQYAVKSCNVLAKTAFRLRFTEGCYLGYAAGDHDTTTLAVALLNTIDAAIQAAKTVGVASIQRQGRILSQGDRGAALEVDGKLFLTLVERTYLKPGLYRLNKPWEMEEGCPAAGPGLIAKLGLPVIVDLHLMTE